MDHRFFDINKDSCSFYGHNRKSEFSNVNILIPIVDRKTWITGRRYPRNDRGQNTIMRLGTAMLAE